MKTYQTIEVKIVYFTEDAIRTSVIGDETGADPYLFNE